MFEYILCRLEEDKEYQVMTTTSLESARKQGLDFKDGYSIYKAKLIEYGEGNNNK